MPCLRLLAKQPEVVRPNLMFALLEGPAASLRYRRQRLYHIFWHISSFCDGAEKGSVGFGENALRRKSPYKCLKALIGLDICGYGEAPSLFFRVLSAEATFSAEAVHVDFFHLKLLKELEAAQLFFAAMHDDGDICGLGDAGERAKHPLLLGIGGGFEPVAVEAALAHGCNKALLGLGFDEANFRIHIEGGHVEGKVLG